MARATKIHLSLLTLAGLLLGGSLLLWSALGPENSAYADAKPTFKGPTKIAVFAGGCFWCMQPPFDATPGVVDTRVGYCGGKERRPTYEQVSTGRTGHTESIKVIYDPTRVSYAQLLDVFWRSMDPTDAGGQFADRGRQYRPAIFYLDDAQRKTALASRDKLAKSRRFKKPIVVEISPATAFWDGEAYHQRFYKKNPTRYYSYRRGSGRTGFLQRVWGKSAH